MSLAKSAESVKAIIAGKPSEESQNKLGMTDGELVYASVPIDMFRFFDREVTKATEVELRRLKEISDWVGGETVGEKVSKVSRLERELGVRHMSESRINRVWNFLKLGRQIDDMRLRQDALKGSVYA